MIFVNDFRAPVSPALLSRMRLRGRDEAVGFAD
jgi:hypothetical protein